MNAGGPLPGDALPLLETAVPGPASRALAERLARVESRNITRISDGGPIVWAEASGANVRDADGNLYIDLTAGFGVAAAGHAPEEVVRAIADQAARLPHALGDVHPADAKVRLLERLAGIAPAGLDVAILGSTGAEAVEAVMKTAAVRTGRSAIVAFEGAYHGLTYGALALTPASHFRAPFEDQLFRSVRFAPFPTAAADVPRVLDIVRGLMAADEVGLVLIEPVQGRGGLRVPPPRLLAGLRTLCDGRTTLLAFDEVYTGLGRTGRWFACEHEGVVPDLMAVGKALGGGLPLSAALGTRDVMDGWPASTGEAIHTSTFLGNPVACAAAVAQIERIERLGLLQRATELGARIRTHSNAWVASGLAIEARGIGLLQGVRVESGARAVDVADRALQEGVLLVTEGFAGDVLAITPPAVITSQQLDHALGVIERALAGG